MEYVYADERIRKQFEKCLQRDLGAAAVKGRDRRLAELVGAENLQGLLMMGGTGNWHVLENRNGDGRKGQIACSITGNYRMIMRPPGIEYTQCVVVEIIELTDYH